MNARWALLLAPLALAACGKVPIYDVGASFSLADVSWFAEEETLFAFWEVTAEQGIGDPSVVEITYRTDDGLVDWTPLTDLPMVHTHLPVDCGTNALCGSASLHVPKEPRAVHLRLRYHRDGSLALDTFTTFNVIGPGEGWEHRSFLVYGVFDEANTRIQWRGRHNFPTLRNEEVTDLGLRRDFAVADRTYGSDELASSDNPYGYDVTCPDTFVPADLPDVSTDERAVFDLGELPTAASDASVVCAQATVTDALGPFTTGALAQKNPEVRDAFPVLRSPVREATPLPFYLEPCERVISDEHEEMQRQRLRIGSLASTCIDDWSQPGFADQLAVQFADAIEAARPAGNDMVLVIGLEQDDTGASDVVQEALAQVVPDEQLRSSPHLSGAFVFDSDGRGLRRDDLQTSTLWCPTNAGAAEGAAQTCAIAPDNPTLDLGPFSFGTLPILPSREQYLDFIDTFSAAQAGEVTDSAFLAPEFSPTADHVAIDGYGVATFLDDELLTADADDAFSDCQDGATAAIVFRSDLLQSGMFLRQLQRECARGTVDAEVCAIARLGLLPIQYLPDWHNQFRESAYPLGLAWDFPFLLHLDYETYVTGSLTAFGFSVPFGVATTGESYLGTAMWTTDTFSLAEELDQCTRFCDHPTFDSAGVYQVRAPFRATYAHSCYVPAFPAWGDLGFPSDP